MDSERSEVGTPPDAASGVPVIGESFATRWLRALYDTPLIFSGIIDGEGVLLDANQLAVEGCGLDRAATVGRAYWDGGWWSPDPALVEQIRQWCRHVLRTGHPVRKQSRYFVGGDVPRVLDLSLLPVSDDSGTVAYIVATGSDITDAVAVSREREDRLEIEAKALKRLAADRAGELRAARASRRRADERLTRLMGAALRMVDAETPEDVTRIVFDQALPVIGADGGAVVVPAEPGVLEAAVSDRLSEAARIRYRTIPVDSQLPVAHVMRTGHRLLLPTRASGIAFSPEMAETYASTGRDAWAFLPLMIAGKCLGSLAVSWRYDRLFDDAELALLEGLAAQCAQALDRIRHLRDARASALAVQRMSEALQRSLLTQPPTSHWLDIAVRYQPASHEAEVGGDWYDAYPTAEGRTVIGVGDVNGHDRDAAAAMGQIRNMLRGLSVDGGDSPAGLLQRLDRALELLKIDIMATAIIARVDADPAGSPGRTRRMYWSNAGHPPPLLRRPDGTVVALDDTSDPLLGFDAGVPRTERMVDLVEGSVLLLYTDGLVERRGESLGEGIDRLAAFLAGAGDRSPDELCDAVLATVPPDHEDDIALLVLRCGDG